VAELKVGDKVWAFDQNRRVYATKRDASYHPSGPPIWREHWVEQEVLGENRASFFIGFSGTVFDLKRLSHYRKLSKADLKAGKCRGFAFSEAEIDRLAWVEENRFKLIERIRQCDDHDTLTKVAELIAPDLVPR
jgi:hypothetical protein